MTKDEIRWRKRKEEVDQVKGRKRLSERSRFGAIALLPAREREIHCSTRFDPFPLSHTLTVVIVSRC